MRSSLTLLLLALCMAVGQASEFDLVGGAPLQLVGDSPEAISNFELCGAPPQVEPAPLGKPQTRQDQCLFFTADSCSWCLRMKQEVFPELRRIGWLIGESPAGHVVVVDVDAQPALAAKYGVTSLPMCVRLRDGKVIRQKVGYQSATAFATWWNGFAEKPKTQKLGSAQWTFPGSTRDELIAHLAGANHGYSVESLEKMSNHDLQRLHDSDHNSVSQTQTVKQQRSFLFFKW